MTRETITPRDRDHWLSLRAQDLTSTDVAALFGMSPYKTRFELWHEKRSGVPVSIPQNDRMKWGSRLESSIAEGIAEDEGWVISPFKAYMRDAGLRIGSSFDFRVLGRSESQSLAGLYTRAPEHDAILEIKTVDALAFRNGWTVTDDFIEAPAHIELQVQHQLLVSGLSVAYIGVLIGGNDVRILRREADDTAHYAIRQEARKFWSSIGRNEAPDPVMPDDARAVIRMHQFAEPGKLFDARGDAGIAELVAEYHRLKRQAKDIDELADARKAELLTKIGDSERVLADGFTISAGMVAAADVSYTRAAYRNFRVTQQKAK